MKSIHFFGIDISARTIVSSRRFLSDSNYAHCNFIAKHFHVDFETCVDRLYAIKKNYVHNICIIKIDISLKSKSIEANLIFLTNIFITRTKLLFKKEEACYVNCSKSIFLSKYELPLFIHSSIGSSFQGFIREHRSLQNRSHLQSLK